MIESVEVRNFQSLHHVDLELSPFTVIVGPSSSGKSALTRAIRVLIENQRGNSFISHGERVSTITAKTSAGVVTLQRGKGTDDNSYTIIPNDPAHPLAPQQKYTKLGGDTPVEVSQFLGINPKDPIAFASQFDKPYLLDERPSEVARVLGELTNVRVIFDAARESNRRKLSSSAELRIRASDLAAIHQKVPAFRVIKDQMSYLDAAADLISHAQEIQEQLDELETVIESVEINSRRIEQMKPLTEIEIPDEEELVSAYNALLELKRALVELVEAQKLEVEALRRMGDANEELEEVDEEGKKIRSEISDDIRQFLISNAGADEQFEDADDRSWIELDAAAELVQRWIEERG